MTTQIQTDKTNNQMYDHGHSISQWETEEQVSSTKGTIYMTVDQPRPKTHWSHQTMVKSPTKYLTMNCSNWDNSAHLYIINNNDFNTCSIYNHNWLILLIIKENHSIISNLYIRRSSSLKSSKINSRQWLKKPNNL